MNVGSSLIGVGALGLKFEKVSTRQDPMTQLKIAKVRQLSKIWDKYRMRLSSLPDDQAAVSVSRHDRSIKRYLDMRIAESIPRVFLRKWENENIFTDLIDRFQGGLKEEKIVGLDLMPEGENEFVENFRGVFFEILHSYMINDFSNIEKFILGGRKTLEFHVERARMLTELQKEAFKITNDDLLGDNGCVLDNGIQNGFKIGSYFHDIQHNVTKNAIGEDLDSKLVIYRIVMGALYKQNMLYKHVEKTGEYWRNIIRKPKGYQFISPRFTIVEMEICQKEIKNKKLDPNRLLYDFHLYSF